MSGSAQAPSVPLNISPMAVLRTSAPISSVCHRAAVECGNQAYRLAAVRRSNLPKAFPFEGKVGGFSRSDEARNPPLPVADTGGCSANEATSFASVSVAKRLCRIVRAVDHAVVVIITI